MVRITATALGNLHNEMVHESSGTILQTDAPIDVGGEASSFSPTDLLATGLLSCILITMGLAANEMNVDLTGATGAVEKIMTQSKPRKIAALNITITIPVSPDAATRQKLEQAAHSCPVHHSLHPEIEKNVVISWAG